MISRIMKLTAVNSHTFIYHSADCRSIYYEATHTSQCGGGRCGTCETVPADGMLSLLL